MAKGSRYRMWGRSTKNSTRLYRVVARLELRALHPHEKLSASIDADCTNLLAELGLAGGAETILARRAGCEKLPRAARGDGENPSLSPP